MDREKVIGGLIACTGETNDCAGHTCPYWDFDDSVVDHGCRIQMELDALALLKEQEAKTPVEREDEGYWYYACPTCGNHEELFREWNYCPFCGQAVKWE